MVFSLIVLNAPWQGQAAQSAFRFAEAVLAAGHELRQVFFYGDGAQALAAGSRAADQPDLDRAWRELGERHGVAILACTTAAERRGVGLEGGGAAKAGTLGQLMLALSDSDRVLTFAD
jgi:tRNA 2-thiouridine synthesizing protein D